MSRLRSAVAAALVLATACGSAPPRTVPAAPAPTSPAVAAATPAPGAATGGELDKVLPLDARIRHGTLPNGLTYYILPNKKPDKRAQLWLAVNAGSVLEDDDQRGLAHFIEHMAFNGTAHFAKSAIVDYLEKIGMQFGADVNAYTSFDETVYQLQVPTDDKSAVETGLDILHEWASAIAFDPAEVEKERGVVLEEWRLGRGAQARIEDKQFPVVFHGSRYGQRLPIGLPDILRKAPREQLLRYYKDWYRPDLMAVVAVGDFDPATMEASIRARFEGLPRPTDPRPRALVPVPHDHEPLITVESDPEMTDTTVIIYDKLAHRRESTVGDYRRVVVEGLYHDMLGQRLAELARDPDAPFLVAFSGTHDLVRTSDVFQRAAIAKEGRVADALALLFREVLRVERHGFTPAELDRAKRRMVRGYQNHVRERPKADSGPLTEEIIRNFLEGEQMPGVEVELQLVQKFLPGIEAAEINRLAQQWGGDAGRVIAIAGPPKPALPAAADLMAKVKAVASSDLPPWDDHADDRPLMAKLPTAGKIAAERTIAEIGVTEWTLSNGARVVVKPTDFQNDEVKLDAFAPGGHSLVKDADFPSARFAGAIVSDAGAGDLDAIALSKLLAGKVVEVHTSIDELEETVTGHASPDDLETFFQLVHLRMSAPHKDPRAFAAWKAGEIETTRNRRQNPEEAFFEDMTAASGGNHLRVRPVTVADLGKVDLDRALAIYRDRFADASGFTFVLVGNVDLAKLRPLVETYLASLPATHRRETWRDVGVRRPRGVKTLAVKAGSEPKSMVFLNAFAPATWSKDGDRDLEVIEKILDIRLREVLREDMSGVYYVQVLARLNRRPRVERRLGFLFSCSPDNVDKLRAATLSEIDSLRKKPVGDVYLQKVRELVRRTHETDLMRNDFWADQLEDAYRWHEDPREIVDIAPVLARATADRVQAAAKKYLGLDQYVLGILSPATTAAQPGAEKDARPAAAR